MNRTGDALIGYPDGVLALRENTMDDLSKEEQILKAVKHTLSNVARDTATPSGMKHPLSKNTIQDIRACMKLISAREAELADAAGRPSAARPHYTDEPQGNVVVPFEAPKKSDE